MDFIEVVEGSTRLSVPKADKLSKSNPVFYNPVMELNRDFSVALCRILKPRTFCDLLSGSGARGIRVAHEAGVKVTLNDLNPRAVELIKENAGLNVVEVQVENKPARALLGESKFDFIDVDPFGPPVEFMDSALQSVNNRGFLGVCATDTSALCGTYPKACVRKYDALSMRTDFYPELGLRILIGFIARNALRHGLGISVLFSHSTMHYFRAYVQVVGRGGVVRDTTRNVSFIQYCDKCLERNYISLKDVREECSCGGRLQTAGPLWNGVFADGKICGEVKDVLIGGRFNTKKEAVRLIDLIFREQEVATPFYDLHKLCSRIGRSVPKMDVFQQALTTAGFKFTRTHFTDLGFRSDAKIKDINGILSSL